MLITDFGYLLHGLLRLELVKCLGQQVIGVDTCLQAKSDTLLVYGRRLALLLIKAACEYFFELFLLVII